MYNYEYNESALDYINQFEDGLYKETYNGEDFSNMEGFHIMDEEESDNIGLLEEEDLEYLVEEQKTKVAKVAKKTKVAKVAKKIDKSKIMKAAWKIATAGAKKFGGSKREYLSEAMKIAWKEAKEKNKKNKK